MDRMEKAKQRLQELRDQIASQRERIFDFDDESDIPLVSMNHVPTPSGFLVKCRRILRGHFGKVYSMHWGGPSRSNCLVSASQDGKLIIWDGQSTNKTAIVPLRSAWVMTCAFEQQNSRLVAAGGLDNICSIYDVSHQGQIMACLNCVRFLLLFQRANAELAGHDGYISSCRFIDEGRILSSSGDSTCSLWDVSTSKCVSTLKDHTGDVMTVDIAPRDPNLFASGSCDTTARIWDLRSLVCVHSFDDHESDINAVKFFPDGHSIGTASDDSTCRMFDMRCYSSVNHFQSEKILCGVTSVDFSSSGRLLFAGYDDYSCHIWDTIAGKQHARELSAHENRVSCIGITHEGNALCTGSWDTLLKVWA